MPESQQPQALAGGGFSHPERIVENLHIAEGASVADFGCGSGYFTILIAQLVGEEGVVTAIDVQEKALTVVQAKAQDAGLYNVKTVRANLEKEGSSGLENDSQDMVLLANILFQSQMKESIFAEAFRVLKHGGELVVIDWLPQTSFGPQDKGWKLSPEEAKILSQKAGFSYIREFPASINHWGLVFSKN